MHISEGILNGPAVAATLGGAAAVTALTLRRVRQDDIPKISVVTAGFFAASLIHFSIGPVSMHLILNGLAGIVLGAAAFPAIAVGLLFQAVMFGHGGIGSLGANALVMGLPALVSGVLFRTTGGADGRMLALRSGVCGGMGVLLAGLFLSLLLGSTGSEFTTVARAALVAHIPLVIIEGVVTALVVTFLHRVRPQVF